MNIIKINKDLDIEIYGKSSTVQKEKNIIENLVLTGNENKDRLIIQQCIDENNLKSDILYNGNTVYPFKNIVNAYRKLQKSDSLKNLTNEMYDFFTNACGDIAHYDINGYKDYYNCSIRNLESELLNDRSLWTRFSDRDRIFKHLKIGKYYNERGTINIDILPINKLKSIIKDCGWNVNPDGNGYWKLSKDINNNTSYSFNVDILNHSISAIMREINWLTNSFNQESYIEEIVFSRGNDEKSPSISKIVSSAKEIKYSLNKLADDVLYKSILESEILMDFKEEETKNYDLDLELEMR